MKVKRKITISDAAYGYAVRRLDGDGPGYVHIGIWLLEPRGGQKLNVRVRFDDPWINYGPIITCPDKERIREVFELNPVTPGEIRRIILAALDFGWHPSAKGAELDLMWDRKVCCLIGL